MGESPPWTKNRGEKARESFQEIERWPLLAYAAFFWLESGLGVLGLEAGNILCSKNSLWELREYLKLQHNQRLMLKWNQ